MLPESAPTCWILTEGIAGTENQCLGLAAALGVDAVVKRIGLKTPWRQLSPYLRFGHARALTPESDPIDPPYPDLLIASGRKSIGAALHIKKHSGGKTFLVQIQDPRIDPALFDLVVVPQHDNARGPNVLTTTAALHRITPEKLAESRAQFAPLLSSLPWPRVAVLIGGNSRAHSMTPETAERLAGQLQHLAARKGVGLMVTASRRTGDDNRRRLQEKLQDLPHCYFWDGAGENPYFGFLAHADYIIVTEDSVSMTSEALTTGKPVYIAGLSGGARRLDAFHKKLEQQGYTRPFTGVLEEWSYTPPDDTAAVAREIRIRMKGKI